MGAYMSEPITGKESEDGSGNQIRYGASTMQGWRTSQEDAHNCIAQFDDKMSLFGVYDGHGGAEVAIYIAKHFPDLLRKVISNSDGDIEKAFIKAYLDIDAKIIEPESLAEIQKIANDNKSDNGEESTTVFEENVSELYEEATMPLDKLVAKYQQSPNNEDGPSTVDNEERPCSSKACTSEKSSASSPSKDKVTENSENTKIPRNTTKTDDSSPSGSNGEVHNTETSSLTSSSAADETTSEVKSGTESEKSETLKKSATNGETGSHASETCNGNINELQAEPTQTEILLDTGSPKKPRKGKVHPTFASPVTQTQPNSSKPKRLSAQLAELSNKAFPDSDSDSDTSESDENKLMEEDSNGSSDSDDVEAEEDSEDEDDSDDEENEDDAFLSGMQEPGYDSGCTAVVALLRWQGEALKLWVANAGDSRCVVSRSGKAVDMSYDHKPELEEETLRIVRAGGKVTDDGRVNGGLNLSRALGDHSYKQTPDLPLEEQMISPLPTVESLDIDLETDDFLVVACDGVWNSMSSQQVVDFVRQRLSLEKPLSKICEELFDVCLAEDTGGDGTGCDNMTAIIVQLPKKSANKRPLEDDETSSECSKKLKVEC